MVAVVTVGIHFDRIEWQIVPDGATAAAALQNGEIDWWEQPLPDLVPLLKRNRNVMLDIAVADRLDTVFFLISVTFVWRSFYAMRVKSSDA